LRNNLHRTIASGTAALVLFAVATIVREWAWNPTSDVAAWAGYALLWVFSTLGFLAVLLTIVFAVLWRLPRR